MKYLGIFMLVVVLSGCYIKYPDQPYHERITQIPTHPHGEQVELYFPGEEPPPKPYFRVTMITVSAPADQNDNALLRELQYKGSLEGVDAIIVTDKSKYSEWVEVDQSPGLVEVLLDPEVANQEVEPIYEPYEVREITGVGIKFPQNMAYIEQYNKSETVYSRNIFTGQWWDIGYVKYNIEGRVEHIQDTLGYLDYFDSYSMSHLVHERSNRWKKRKTNEFQIDRIFYNERGYRVKKVRILFDEQKRPSKITVRPARAKVDEVIKCIYDNNGRLVSREMKLHQVGDLTEERVYDTLGRLVSCVYKDKDGKEKYSRKWEYFTLDDVMNYAK